MILYKAIWPYIRYQATDGLVSETRLWPYNRGNTLPTIISHFKRHAPVPDTTSEMLFTWKDTSPNNSHYTVQVRLDTFDPTQRSLYRFVTFLVVFKNPTNSIIIVIISNRTV